MSSYQSVPRSGNYGNIYFLRPNGFNANGTTCSLNDLVWGSYSNASASSHFEVKISTEGTPDKFDWRENFGNWNQNTNITGVSQDLVGANGTQSITFGAITGHTNDTFWSRGNYYSESTTKNDDEVQVSNVHRRLVNPNSPPVWTDSGGEVLLQVDFTRGWALFSDTVTTVTVTGSDGYILESGLDRLGSVQGFSITPSLDLIETTSFGEFWKTYIPGQSGLTGTIDKLFIANKNLFDVIEDSIDGTQKYFLLELFSFDYGADQTGDAFLVWCTINNWGVSSTVGDAVRSNISFTAYGAISMSAVTTSSSTSSTSTTSSTSSTSSSSSTTSTQP